MIRTILVDDHAVVRLGYRSLLEIAGDIVVIAEAETGEEAYQSFLAMGPDVIVMDLALPGMGGLEVTRRILRRDASAKVLVFSMYDPSRYPPWRARALTTGKIPVGIRAE